MYQPVTPLASLSLRVHMSPHCLFPIYELKSANVLSTWLILVLYLVDCNSISSSILSVVWAYTRWILSLHVSVYSLRSISLSETTTKFVTHCAVFLITVKFDPFLWRASLLPKKYIARKTSNFTDFLDV